MPELFEVKRNKMSDWRTIVPENEREIYQRAGYGKSVGFGLAPAVLVVDMNYNFVGERDEPIELAQRQYPQSCGHQAWAAIRSTARLLDAAREHGVPVFFSTVVRRRDRLDDIGAAKQSRDKQKSTDLTGERGVEIVAELKVAPDDFVIPKPAASFFPGTALLSLLISRRIDTLIIVGGTTSGCVRSTAIDGHAYGYRVVVVEDGVFDRSGTSHDVNLFEIDQKFGDVVQSEAVIAFLEGV